MVIHTHLDHIRQGWYTHQPCRIMFILPNSRLTPKSLVCENISRELSIDGSASRVYAKFHLPDEDTMKVTRILHSHNLNQGKLDQLAEQARLLGKVRSEAWRGVATLRVYHGS